MILKSNIMLQKKITIIDVYFGKEITDNYRWLEDDLSEQTEDWVIGQNKTTNSYLNEIPYRESLKSRLNDLWDYEKISAPFVEGDYNYFYKNTGLQNQSVLYREREGKDPEVFLILIIFLKTGQHL